MYILPTAISSLYLHVYIDFVFYCIKIWPKITRNSHQESHLSQYLVVRLDLFFGKTNSDFLQHLNQAWNGWVIVEVGKCPNRIPIENFGQYYTIRINTWQYLAIFDDIEQYLNVPYNVTTRVSWNSHLNNIEQCWTILGNIGQYWPIFGNITWYWSILVSIVQYLTVPNNIASHLKIKARPLYF